MSSTMENTKEAEVITSSSMDVYASASSSSCTQYSTARSESIGTLSESIEESKVHWSILSEEDTDVSHEQIKANNIEVFERLQLHPQLGPFFIAMSNEATVAEEDKFAEGAQAEILNFPAEWQSKTKGELRGWILKVFKKGTLLQHLQSQWPHEYIRWIVEGKSEKRFGPCVAFVARGMLLPTGQFAFFMKKEVEDLRRLIVRKRSHCVHGSGPFEKEKMELILYWIASGMNWLHKHNIVHRDLKASNVLVSNGICYVADFECSIGVIGTGFWRDPQILQACVERNASQRPELFTRAADVYSYGMTCYEVLTGKIPFEGEAMTMDLVIEGRRPQVPELINDWIKDLLYKCWETNRHARPTFEEILKSIGDNSMSSLLKSTHAWRMKVDSDEIKPLLGCNKLSHGLEMLECSPYESGVYVCKLCLKEGNEAVYHCSSCGDFDLHPRCATIPIRILSFLHPHSVYLQPGFFQKGQTIFCDACQLEIIEGNYYNSYTCEYEDCNFDLHIHCAKYARAMSHHLHEEHELVLAFSSTCVEVGTFSQVCNDCNIELDPLEIVYCCRECGFNIHPHCIIDSLECKSCSESFILP